MISILSPTAFRIFSNGSMAVFICSAVMNSPWFSIAAGSNGQIFIAEMPDSKRLSARTSARFMNPSKSSYGLSSTPRPHVETGLMLEERT
jgi:hypothetical protein